MQFHSRKHNLSPSTVYIVAWQNKHLTPDKHTDHILHVTTPSLRTRTTTPRLGSHDLRHHHHWGNTSRPWPNTRDRHRNIRRVPNDHAGVGLYIQTKSAHNPSINIVYSYTFDGEQSILRAELIGIRQAVILGTRLLQETMLDTLNIFTDSLCSLQLLTRMKLRPNTLRYHTHRNLLNDILNLIHNNPLIHIHSRK